MKLVRFRGTDGETRRGFIRGKHIVPLIDQTPSGESPGFADLLQTVTEHGVEELQSVFDEIERVPRSDLSFLPPIPSTGRLFCLGAVYTGHMQEEGLDLTFDPNQWVMPENAIVPDGASIILPRRVAEDVMPAAELCVVIGRTGKYIDPMAAYEHIAGYTISNDVTARTEWPGAMAYKMMDTFSPLGPHVQTIDEVPSPMDLQIEMRQDDSVICRGSTAGMRFSLSFLVSYMSTITKLRPGDVISAGDPGGVTEPLRVGSTVEIEIQNIGTLKNDVALESDGD